MDTVPDEVLLLIAELLSASHRPSLVCFSLASRRCRRVSRVVLFRQVDVALDWDAQADWDEQAGPELRTCFNRLELSKAFALVQTLVLRPAVDEEETLLFNKFPYPEQLALTSDVYDQLAKLFTHLPNLGDFHFGFNASRPGRLHELLSTYAPTCRVHLASLRFETLHLDPAKLDPGERAIASWHNLCSFTVGCDRFRSGHIDYTRDAALDMITRHAPNLQDVTIYMKPGEHPLLEIRPDPPYKPWNGFPGGTGDEESRGQLKRLQFVGIHIGPSDIQDLANHVDFSVLQHLEVGFRVDTGAMQRLTEANLHCLRSLSIGLDRDKPEDIVLFNSFFGNLSPLEHLEINGAFAHSTLERILELHGATMRTLSLPRYSSLSLFHVRQLADSCKRLESLKLSIKRSLGDAKEIAAYQALGSIRRLQFLTIMLDASNATSSTDPEEQWHVMPPIPDYFDEFDRESFPLNGGSPEDVRYGHMREALINSAVDQILALQMFSIIEGAKPSGSFEIQQISLKSVGGGSFGQRSSTSHICEVFDQVSRWWQVSRHIRDDQREKPVIEELQGRGTPDRSYSSPSLHRDMEPIFRKVWPSKFSENGEESDWRSDWHSLPLSSR